VGEQSLHLQVDAVGPSEADDVALVSGRDGDVGGTADYVVFFADGGVGQKILQDGLGEFFRDAGGIGEEAVLREAVNGQPVCGGPSVGEVPLGAGVVVAHGEAAVVFEERKMMPE
jgi:hypothetical protein